MDRDYTAVRFFAMSRDDPQTNIRLPADLKDALTKKARENNRSMSAEIVYRLAESFKDVGALTQQIDEPLAKPKSPERRTLWQVRSLRRRVRKMATRALPAVREIPYEIDRADASIDPSPIQPC
jgi:hypothetical protein